MKRADLMGSGHRLPDCFLVRYGDRVGWLDTVTCGDQLCEQLWADTWLGGINWRIRRVRRSLGRRRMA